MVIIIAAKRINSTNVRQRALPNILITSYYCNYTLPALTCD